MRTHILGIAVSALLLGACAPRSGRALRGGAAKAAIPPFSAEQIRGGLPTGAVLVFQLLEPGAAPVTSRWEVLRAEDDGVTIQYTQGDAQRVPVGEPVVKTTPWTELESHGRFPPAATEWSDGPVEVGAGRFEGARTFVVHKVEDGQPVELHYTFALDLPGPPIRVRTLRQGVELQRTELLERTTP